MLVLTKILLSANQNTILFMNIHDVIIIIMRRRTGIIWQGNPDTKKTLHVYIIMNILSVDILNDDIYNYYNIYFFHSATICTFNVKERESVRDACHNTFNHLTEGYQLDLKTIAIENEYGHLNDSQWRAKMAEWMVAADDNEMCTFYK